MFWKKIKEYGSAIALALGMFLYTELVFIPEETWGERFPGTIGNLLTALRAIILLVSPLYALFDLVVGHPKS